MPIRISSAYRKTLKHRGNCVSARAGGESAAWLVRACRDCQAAAGAALHEAPIRNDSQETRPMNMQATLVLASQAAAEREMRKSGYYK